MDKSVLAFSCAVVMLVSVPALAQPARPQTPPDIAAEWRLENQEEDTAGQPPLGDYLGIPFNDAGRQRADTTAESLWGTPEYQCRPHSAPHQWRGLGGARILKEQDPLTREVKAYHVQFMRSLDRPIFMDGRPHPPAHAAHTWAGFSTARWDGDALTVFTTHLKAGWLQRNGVAHSDQATMTERFIRHGNILTVVSIVDDPIYLEEPFIRTTNWVLNPGMEIRRTQFDVVDEVAGRQKGDVPHYLPESPGALQKLKEFATHVGLPPAAARGGAATTYPEYQWTMQLPGSGSYTATAQRLARTDRSRPVRRRGRHRGLACLAA